MGGRIDSSFFKMCLNCGFIFRVKGSHWEKQIYCSKECEAEHYSIRLTGKNNPHFSNASEKIFQKCGKRYFSYQPSRKFCSHKCYSDSISKEEITRRSKLGTAAAKVYWESRPPRPKLIKIPTGKRPGPQREYTKIVLKKCSVCGNSFPARGNGSGRQKTCSKICASKYQSIRQKGEKSHLWQNGKTSESMRLRNSLEYSEWRKSVFVRDGYACRKCGQVGGVLNAHHIESWSKNSSLRFDVSNGITLCLKCHGETDSFAARMVCSKKKYHYESTPETNQAR